MRFAVLSRTVWSVPKLLALTLSYVAVVTPKAIPWHFPLCAGRAFIDRTLRALFALWRVMSTSRTSSALGPFLR